MSRPAWLTAATFSPAPEPEFFLDGTRLLCIGPQGFAVPLRRGWVGETSERLRPARAAARTTGGRKRWERCPCGSPVSVRGRDLGAPRREPPLPSRLAATGGTPTTRGVWSPLPPQACRDEGQSANAAARRENLSEWRSPFCGTWAQATPGLGALGSGKPRTQDPPWFCHHGSRSPNTPQILRFSAKGV